ncbi:MAG: hypothetical protein E7235_03020 [Lachnospiraceae bacterium]|nr:hypothetical protein [Lachnospiraceae bacterium]
MEDKKNFMFITRDKTISGSVTDETERLTIVLNGIDDGIYDIYLSGIHKAEADTRGRGRFVKRIDEIFGGDVVIKKDGEEIAWIKEDIKEEEITAYELEEEKVQEEEKNEEIREDYSVSPDISAIIARFRDQMARLENESVIDKKDIGYIEDGKKEKEEKPEDKWEMISPDDLWGLPIKDIRLPSSLFCIYGQLKFRHLYMMEMSDRYRVAVPDIFKNENMQYASRNGFYCISTLDGREVKEGEVGYWMADILKN